MTDAATPPPVLNYAGTTPTAFVSGHQRAVVAAALLGVCCFILLVSIGSDFAQLNLLQNVKLGVPVTQTAAQNNDLRQQVIGVAQLLMVIVTAVFFLMWVHRAYRNLPALRGGRRTRWSPASAVGYFFVPILNLFRPYQVLSEIVEGSQPSGSSSAIAGAWWSCWVLSGVIGRFSSASGTSGGVQDLIFSTESSIASSVVALVAGALAIIMVMKVDRMQAEASQLVDQYPPVTVQPGSLLSIPPPAPRR